MEKLLALLLLVLAESAAAAIPRDAWLYEIPEDLRRPVMSSTALADEQFSEIPASKLQSAEERLAKAAASELKEDYEIAAFAPRGFSCKRGSKAFLVRALYEYGERGHWEVFFSKGVLLVRNSALGAPTKTFRSSLVLCLATVPTKTYVEVTGGM